MTIEERFWSKVSKRGPDDCWLWLAGKFTSGHGSFWTGSRDTQAHRFAYELLVGPIPEGLDVDHLCLTPACVNPKHLEPVSHSENTRRSWNHREAPTECIRGHPYSEDNVYIRPDSGYRCCRECRREAVRKYWQKKLR